MKNVVLFILLFISITTIAQKKKQDIVLDTVTYHYVSLYPNGKIKEASEHLHEKEGGKWIYFDSTGEEIWRGSYNKKGKREGDWWHRKKEVTTYKNGDVMKKGIGCDPCPEGY